MQGYTLLSARFTDNERQTVEALWTNEQETIANYCQASDNDAMWRDLLTHITIEQIHENTYRYIKEKQQEIQDVLLSIAKKEGLIYDTDSEINKAVVKVMTMKFDPEIHKEQLFTLKLELFEQDLVKRSTDKELKKKLRKAATILEAIKVAIEIFETTAADASPETAG
jgi:hypothetical protein